MRHRHRPIRRLAHTPAHRTHAPRNHQRVRHGLGITPLAAQRARRAHLLRRQGVRRILYGRARAARPHAVHVLPRHRPRGPRHAQRPRRRHRRLRRPARRPLGVFRRRLVSAQALGQRVGMALPQPLDSPAPRPLPVAAGARLAHQRRVATTRAAPDGRLCAAARLWGTARARCRAGCRLGALRDVRRAARVAQVGQRPAPARLRRTARQRRRSHLRAAARSQLRARAADGAHTAGEQPDAVRSAADSALRRVERRRARPSGAILVRGRRLRRLLRRRAPRGVHGVHLPARRLRRLTDIRRADGSGRRAGRRRVVRVSLGAPRAPRHERDREARPRAACDVRNALARAARGSDPRDGDGRVIVLRAAHDGRSARGDGARARRHRLRRQRLVRHVRGAAGQRELPRLDANRGALRRIARHRALGLHSDATQRLG